MADAQYVIDIAAQIAGGTESLAQLDALADQLSGMGARAAVFDDAMIKLATGLRAADEAARAAANALADGRTEFAQIERAAVNAQKAFEKASLRGVVPKAVADEVERTQRAVQDYAETLTGLERAAADAAGKQERLQGTLAGVRQLSQRVNQSHAQETERLGKIQGALGALGGPLGRLGQLVVGPVKAFASLSSAVGAAAAAAAVAVVGVALLAAAVVALGIAAGTALVSFGTMAATLADAGRSAALTREAFEANSATLRALRGTIAGLVDSTGLAEADLRGLVGQLEDAKVAAGNMPAALRAAALAEKALGKGGAAKFVADIKAGKLAVGEFANDAERKFGGIVARQMMSLDAQVGRAKRNWAGLFDGLDIDPVLGGMSTLVGILDKNTASGRFLRAVFEGVLQPLINQAQNAAHVVEAFVLGFMIGATKLYIALKPTIKAVSDLLGVSSPELSTALDVALAAGEMLVPVFAVLAIGVSAVVALFVLAAAPIIAMAVGLTGLAVAAGTVASALGGVVSSAIAAVRSALGAAAGIGGDLVRGLADGITGAAGAVVAAVTGAVGGAISAAKRMLGIASPSKVFASIGAYTGEGFATGVDAAAPAAHEAVAGLVAPPANDVVPPAIAIDSPLARQDTGGGAERRDAPPPAAAAGGASVHDNTFNFYGVKDAGDAEQRFAEMWESLISGDADAVAGGRAT